MTQHEPNSNEYKAHPDLELKDPAKLAERFAERLRLFDQVLSSTSDFAYSFDRSGKFTFANKALLDLWGLGLEQAVGKNFFDLDYPPEVAAKLQRQIQQVFDTAERVIDETSYTNPRGQTGYYQYIFSPVRGPSGQVEAVAGSTRDISHHRMLELERSHLTRAVEGERAKLQAIIAQAPAFICTLRGPEHVCELANDKYYAVVGRRDILGQTIRAALPELEGQGFFELLDHVYRTGKSYVGTEMPMLLQRERGSGLDLRYMNLTYQALRDDDGNITGIFVHGVDVTDSVRARDAVRERDDRLRTSEERLAFALDAADLGTFHCPLPMNEIYWSDKCSEHFWLPPEARVTFERFYSIIHPDDRERTRSAIEQAVYHRKPYDTEYRTVSPDGRVRWIRARGRAYYDSSGYPTRFDGVTLDMTEQKNAQLALQENEEFHRFAAEAGRTGSWYIKLDTMDCVLSPMMTELMAFPPGKTHATAEEWMEPVRAEDRPRLERAMKETIQKNAPFECEFRITLKDGTERWLYSRGGAVRDAMDRPLRLHGASVDVTERRRADAERERLLTELHSQHERTRESEDRFRVALANAPASVYTNDTDLRYTWIHNPRFGRGSENIIGKRDQDLLEYGSVKELISLKKRVLATGKSERKAITTTIDGQEYTFDVTVDTQRNTERQIIGLIVATFDVTELMRARREAEAASKAKDRFLAVLSHELRTPLSPVVMTIPAIEIDPELPFKFREDLAMMRRNIDLEVKLIDDLLDLSRVTSGKLRLHMQRVSVHELLRHAIHNSVSDASGKRLIVRQELEATNDRLVADPARLQQVFWNLLRNAVKFTPEKGLILIRTFNSEDGASMFVEVRDTGVGIPPEVLPKVFDAFEQGDARMTRQFGGLGLGLAIAKAVVEMHGGSITAASPGRGKGATFTVRLEMQETGMAAESQSPRQAAETRAEARTTRLLLVEDHTDTARTMARLLRGAGYDVTPVNSVEAALEAAAATPFKVVVSDIGLPDATGYDLMRKLRRLYPIKGIALSGYGMEEDVRKSREAGFSEHLVKPVNIAQLLAMLGRVSESA